MGIGGFAAGTLVLILALAMRGGSRPETNIRNNVEVDSSMREIPVNTTPPPVAPPALVTPSKAVNDTWVKSVQAMPRDEQATAVTAKLKELNPGFDGQAKIVGNRFFIEGKAISNIAALRALTHWKMLSIQHTQVSDLSPLSELKLVELNVFNSAVRDISVLRGMPLQTLIGSGPCDMSPIKDKNLSYLMWFDNPEWKDASFLSAMPLNYLGCRGTGIRDFSPLKNSNLAEICFDYVPDRDMAIIKGIATLKKINDLPAAEFWAKNSNVPSPATPNNTSTDRELPKELALDLGGGIKMEMVLVPAGEFVMGDDKGNFSEKPAHPVRISRPFYIGKYEVTVAQFRRFVETEKYETECERNGNKGWTAKDGKWQETSGINWKMPGFKQEDNHPVVLVNWNDTQAFNAWASKQTGRDMRLPTEAQWEFAARGTDNKKYPWGETWVNSLANHNDVNLKNTKFQVPGTNENDGFTYTSPVGNYKNASACGAIDMAGNVWEWVNDKHQVDYYSKGPALDPTGAENGNRGLRGGSWKDVPEYLQAAHRNNRRPSDCGTDLGFRVALPAKVSAVARPLDDPVREAKLINLLPLIDPMKDSPTGRWQIREGTLVSNDDEFARTEIPYHPPEEYDFLIEFTPKGKSDVNQLLSKNGKIFHWMAAGASNVLQGFAMVNGEFRNATTVLKSPALEYNRRYTSLVQVRNGGAKAFINGVQVSELKTNYENVGPLPRAQMNDPAALGLLTHMCPTIFHKIEVVEITGTGKLLQTPKKP
jgi:formylglycine-generating enzyme